MNHRRSASDAMDTTEPKPGPSGAAAAPAAAPVVPAAAAAVSADLLSTDTFKEADVANMTSMGFPRAACIAELRKVGFLLLPLILILLQTGGDANVALANMFAKSLAESFNKKK